jgi:hypothetical protein
MGAFLFPALFFSSPFIHPAPKHAPKIGQCACAKTVLATNMRITIARIRPQRRISVSTKIAQ